MKPAFEPHGVHGFDTGDEVVWDDARLPGGFWNVMEELPNGCWVDRKVDRQANYRETVVSRLLHLPWSEVFSATPTCGNTRCCRPAHLCVIIRNPLSDRPKGTI